MTFLQALKKNRMGFQRNKRWRVVLEQHKNGFVLDDGSCFAIEDDGNICGICKSKGSKQSGSEILQKAITKGGTKLQAFGQKLFAFYTSNRFRPIAWCEFDERYAPNEWKKEYGHDPLIFYAYDPNYTPCQRGLFFLFMCQTKPCKNATEAYKKRDEWIKKGV